MSKLVPERCPFCGGKAELEVMKDGDEYLGHIYCVKCEADMQYWRETINEASKRVLEVWNSRLIDHEERTCHVSAEFIDHEPTIDSLGIVWFECDKCGWGWYEGEICCYPSKPHYCPHCGARVVSKDE